MLAIKKKTKAVLFEELQVGDVVEVSYSFGGWYGSAPSVELSFKGTTHYNNALQFRKNTANFEIEQV